VVKAVLDTNILIDYLQGSPAARTELALYDQPAISAITWMEVMVGTTPETEAATRSFLAGFEVLPIGEMVAEEAVRIRRDKRIKLPDAIIWATARVKQCLLVTRNNRDMEANDPGVRVPYMV
jgi:predicted nucleic acid-binding protein